jgi:hypothetical protein
VNRYLVFASSFLVYGFVLLCLSCASDDETPPPNLPDPSIIGFSPAVGILGDIVTVQGENFSVEKLDNIVQFNGIPAAVQSATTNVLTVVVPDSATSGKIKVTVAGKAVSSADDFTVLTPTIGSVTPLVASPGLSIFIAGTNYSTVPGKNVVYVGGAKANVVASDGMNMEVEIPDAATTGKVVVNVGTQKAVSAEEVMICSSKAELVVSDIEITSTNAEKTSFSFTCTITNFGIQPLDLADMLLQNYVSADELYGGGDMPAGGFILDAGGVLQQGQSYEVSWTSNADYSAHPYLIVTVAAKDGQEARECTFANNVAAKLIE